MEKTVTTPFGQQTIIDFITNKINHMTQIPNDSIDIDKPLIDFGLSSFLAVELNFELKNILGKELPFMLISSGASIREVALEMTAQSY